MPGLFRTLVLERLRLPLEVWKTSACGAPSWTRTDGIGRHAQGFERPLARVCREAPSSAT